MVNTHRSDAQTKGEIKTRLSFFAVSHVELTMMHEPDMKRLPNSRSDIKVAQSVSDIMHWKRRCTQ